MGLLLLVGGTWVPQAAGLRILVVHPLYAGSHVLTLQVRQSVDHCCNDGDVSLLLFQSVTAELLKHGHSVTTVKFQDTNLPPLPTSGHPNFTLVGAVIVIVMFKGLPRSTSASTTVSGSCRSQRQENRRSSGFPSSSSGAQDRICSGPSVSNHL